jgi:hypothetical protein
MRSTFRLGVPDQKVTLVRENPRHNVAKVSKYAIYPALDCSCWSDDGRKRVWHAYPIVARCVAKARGAGQMTHDNKPRKPALPCPEWVSKLAQERPEIFRIAAIIFSLFVWVGIGTAFYGFFLG